MTRLSRRSLVCRTYPHDDVCRERSSRERRCANRRMQERYEFQSKHTEAYGQRAPSNTTPCGDDSKHPPTQYSFPYTHTRLQQGSICLSWCAAATSIDAAPTLSGGGLQRADGFRLLCHPPEILILSISLHLLDLPVHVVHVLARRFHRIPREDWGILEGRDFRRTLCCYSLDVLKYLLTHVTA